MLTQGTERLAPMKRLFFLGSAALAITALVLSVALTLLASGRSTAAEELRIGQAAPAFTYRLIDGATLKPSDLRGHAYVLWLMATWCSSCQGGTAVVGQHIAELRARGVRVVQLEVANDLGYPGPPLSAFRKAVGAAGSSPNWYWGTLTEGQSLALDPRAYPDIYYLVDARSRVVGIDGAPAATWSKIAAFAAEVCPRSCH